MTGMVSLFAMKYAPSGRQGRGGHSSLLFFIPKCVFCTQVLKESPHFSLSFPNLLLRIQTLFLNILLNSLDSRNRLEWHEKSREWHEKMRPFVAGKNALQGDREEVDRIILLSPNVFIRDPSLRFYYFVFRSDRIYSFTSLYIMEDIILFRIVVFWTKMNNIV